MQSVPGQWLGIPDFGLTELLSGGNAPAWANNPNVYKAAGTTQQQYSNDVAQNAQYAAAQQGQAINPYAPYKDATTQNASPQTSGGGGGGGSPAAPNPDTTYVWDPGLGQMRKISDLQKEAQQREANIRSGINSGYDQYSSGLDSLLAQYPQWQQADEQLVGDSYGSQITGLQQGMSAANQKLDTSKTQVADRTKETIAKQTQNLRNILKASQTQLSAMGSGDSSATEKMLPYAYAKMGAKEQGSIYKQANQQYADIDKQAVDVQSQYNQGVQQADQWKSNSLMAIRDKYTPQIARIQEMKARVPLDKQQALASLETSLLSQARQDLSNIEAQDTSFRQNLTLQAQQQMANLVALKASLDKSGSYNPADLTFNTLASLQGNGGGQGNGNSNGNYLNPAQLLKKQKEEQMSQYL